MFNRQHVEVWLNELRNGGHKQTQGKLTNLGTDENGNKTVSHCCLGVGCMAAHKSGVPMVIRDGTGDHTRWYDGNAGTMPEVVQQWYGTDDNPVLDRGRRCSSANDMDNLSFEEIADLIEARMNAEEPDPLTPFQRQWVRALRFGDYNQGQRFLAVKQRDEQEFGHCCLGVAYEEAIKNGAVIDKQETAVPGECLTIRYDGAQSLPSLLFTDEIGLRTSNGVVFLPDEDGNYRDNNESFHTASFLTDRLHREISLASLNDGGLTYDQIADVIEHFARGIFKPRADGA